MDDINNLSRKVLLLDVADAEELAKPFIKDVVGLDKLKVSDSFHSFGGLASAPAISLNGVDNMSPTEKREWIACRLWAVCQKIRQMDKCDKEVPPRAGILLADFKNQLANSILRKSAGASGGKKQNAYTADLYTLIQKIIVTVESDKPADIKAAVFANLPGNSEGIIEEITSENIDGKIKVVLKWSSDDARNSEGEQLLGRSAIDKIVKKLLSN